MQKKPQLLRLEALEGGPKAGTFIAQLDDLPGHGGKDVLFGQDQHRINIFIQRWQGDVYVYENRCPHAHTPLNMMNDRFLNLNKSALICRTHGALFNVQSGECTGGPCKGQYLREVAFEVKDGAVYSV